MIKGRMETTLSSLALAFPHRGSPEPAFFALNTKPPTTDALSNPLSWCRPFTASTQPVMGLHQCQWLSSFPPICDPSCAH